MTGTIVHPLAVFAKGFHQTLWREHNNPSELANIARENDNRGAHIAVGDAAAWQLSMESRRAGTGLVQAATVE